MNVKMNGNMLTESVKVEVVIKLFANGQIQVTGPLGDKIMMFGILELAKEVVRAQAVPEPPKIAPISIVPKFEH